LHLTHAGSRASSIQNFASAPKKAAGIYGDDRFVAMMFAKVICVQLISVLGYNFLFQDVDVVWYKDPVQYFNEPRFKRKYDVIFQDDGGHSTRYCPYSANSGFYFSYANDRTQHFFNSLLTYGSLIISTHSHQQALIALLNEHVSLHGLRAKVVSRDSADLPGGYQWNQKSGKYMRALFAGEIKPVIFHMSWTENSSFKRAYFQQMAEWYVQDQCVGKTKEEIYAAFGSRPDDLGTLCCAAEPLVSCHYRDKPSKIPCRESPAIDHGKRKSFW
jgi:Nucleotide-diphospho-sugar transferase